MQGIFTLEESFEPLSLLQAKATDYVDGTRLEWKDQVETWYNKGKSCSWRRVMTFIEPAGCGKSVMMAHLGMEGGLGSRKRQSSVFATLKNVGERLSGKRRDLAKFTVGAAHFFKYDDFNAASVRVCLLSIANQLSVTIPGVKKELSKLDLSTVEAITDLKVLFRSLLCTPMIRVKAPGHPVVILLDGLDEARPEEKGELVDILTSMWESDTPPWLGVIVSSRPESLLKNKLENCDTLQLGKEENVKDLSTVLRKQLVRCMKPGEHIGRALEIMTKRCEGWFLYAGFLDKLLQEKEEHSLKLRDIRKVEEFPPGLERVFRTYFTRFLQVHLENNYDQYQTLLSSMVAARSPLDRATVAALMGFEKECEIETFLFQLGHFVLVDDQDRIRFMHTSMCDFLRDRRLAGRVPEKELLVGGKRLGVSNRAGDKWLADVVKSNPRSPFAMEHLIYYLCIERDWEGVKGRLLDFDWLHAAVSFQGVAKRLVDDTDSLYNYQTFSDINVTDVIRTIELGGNHIEEDPESLAFQLLGRIADRSHPILVSLYSSEFAKKEAVQSVHVPIRATLEPARSPLRKVLEGHLDAITSVAIDGDIVASGSEDETVRLWDRQTGDCVQVFEGRSDSVRLLAIFEQDAVSTSSDNTLMLSELRDGNSCTEYQGHSGTVNAVAIDEDTLLSGSDDETVRLWDRFSNTCLKLEGHSASVRAVAIDADIAVSGSKDATVRLWDRHTGECLHVLEGHTCDVEAVAIGGDTVVSGSKDAAVRLWNPRSGECLLVLEGHSNSVIAVAIDGDAVVSGSEDKTVRLWNRQSGECSRVLEGHTDVVNTVAIRASTVVSGSTDSTVRIWDRESGECLHELEGHCQSVVVVAFFGDVVLSGADDISVRFWDGSCGSCLHVTNGYSAAVTAIAIDGEVLMSGSNNATVHLWNRHTGDCLHVLKGHTGKVTAVAVDRDSMVSGSNDSTVRIWDRRSGECLHVLEGQLDDSIRSLAINGDTVVSGSSDGFVQIWDRRTGTCLHLFEGWGVYVAIDGDTLVSGTLDGTVRIADLRTGNCLHVIEGWGCCIASDGDTVVSCAHKCVRVWDRRSGKCLQVLEGHSDNVIAVAIDGDTIVSGSLDGTLRIWDRRVFVCSKALEGHSDDVNAVAIDGNLVVSCSVDKSLRMWDLRSGDCLQVLKGHTDNVLAVAIDGDTVVSGSGNKNVSRWESGDNTVRLWDWRSGQCLHVLKGHGGPVSAVAIDGDTVVSGSEDETVRLWHRQSGNCLHVLQGDFAYVRCVAIDGDTVASGSWDGCLLIWDRRYGECLDVLEEGESVNDVAIDGDIVVSVSDETITLWDRRSRDCLQRLEGHSDVVKAVAIEKNTVFSGSEDMTVRLWDRLSGDLERVMAFDGSVTGVAVGVVDGNCWIAVSETVSKAPHILAPLSTVLKR